MDKQHIMDTENIIAKLSETNICVMIFVHTVSKPAYLSVISLAGDTFLQQYER